MNAPNVIIIKKKNKGHGAHGAAWKVAYADFVTAMMALFMVLWLLSQTDKELQKELSEYFRTGVFSGAPSMLEGGSGLLGGVDSAFADDGRADSCGKTTDELFPEVAQHGSVLQKGGDPGVSKEAGGSAQAPHASAVHQNNPGGAANRPKILSGTARG